MWWLSIAWLLIGATITNIVVWTPLLLDAALSGDFSGQLKARRAASSDPRAEVCVCQELLLDKTCSESAGCIHE